MTRVALLVNRIKNIAPFLTGAAILVRVDGNNVEIDAGSNSQETMKHAATEFFHLTYTTSKNT